MAVSQKDASVHLLTAGIRWLRRMADSSTTIVLNGQQIRTLRDIVPERPGLRVLFVGKTPTTTSVRAGHYFQGPQGQMFWNKLKRYHLLRQKTEYEDESLLEHGFGITDIAKIPRDYGEEPSAQEYGEGIDRIRTLIREHKPRVVIFIYKRVLDRILELRFGMTERSRYGFNAELDHMLGSRVFVFPMPGTPCNARDADAAMRQLSSVLKSEEAQQAP